VPNRLAISLLAVLFLCRYVTAQDADRGKLDFFESKVRPLLFSKCTECHSAEKQEGNLRLDSREAILKGGDYGPALKAGAPDESWIVKATRYDHDDLKMPPTGKLAQGEIDTIAKWVADGAAWPASSAPTVDPTGKPTSPVVDANFWAFQPVKPQAAPEVADAAWPKSAIDRFILARLEQAKLRPTSDASRATLVRRLTFDLTGLPPAPADVEAFVNDVDSRAIEELVDRLLASPAFGERFGRHWLDVTYFADTTGIGRRTPLNDAWRYRDYVIAAFNGDMPYDQFTREQIAGDQLPAADDATKERQLTATGFVVLGPWHHFDMDREKLTMDVVDLQIDALGRTFMGLTLGCARCHDHKFDPITAKDYYALAGIFKSTKTINGSSVNLTDLPQSTEEVQAHAAAKQAWENHEKGLTTEKDEAAKKIGELGKQIASLNEPPQPVSTTPGPTDGPDEKSIAEEKRELEKEIKKLRGRIGQIDGDLSFWRQVTPTAKRAFSAADREAPADVKINLRGNVHVLGEVSPRGFPEVIRWEGAPSPNLAKSGRLELANWLADPRHPLAARVYVNRLWKHLFGAGLVPTADNFGSRGDRPSHPELLDYLAGRLVELDWSTKALVREMILTRTYQLDSRVVPECAAVDPDNKLLWRMSPRRLEAEAIRDSVLAVSGQLDLTRGGPTLPITRANLHINTPSFLEDDAKIEPHVKNRRSVYQPIMRGSLFRDLDVLTLFDFADPDQIVAVRAATTVPTQSLFLLNSDFIKEAAQAIAKGTLSAPDRDDSARVRDIYLKLFGRAPSEAETGVAAEYLNSLGMADAAQRENAWTEYCRALLISAEFLYRR
jgi:hypothetical protein